MTNIAKTTRLIGRLVTKNDKQLDKNNQEATKVETTMRFVGGIGLQLVLFLSCHDFVNGSDVMRIKDSEHYLRRRDNEQGGIVRSRNNGDGDVVKSGFMSSGHDDSHRPVTRLRQQRQLRNLNGEDATDKNDDTSIVSDAAPEEQEQQQQRQVTEHHSESLEEELEEGYERHDDPPEERDVPGDAVFLRTSSTNNNIFAKRAGRYDQIERNKKKIATSKQQVRTNKKREVGNSFVQCCVLGSNDVRPFSTQKP